MPDPGEQQPISRLRLDVIVTDHLALGAVDGRTSWIARTDDDPEWTEVERRLADA